MYWQKVLHQCLSSMQITGFSLLDSCLCSCLYVRHPPTIVDDALLLRGQHADVACTVVHSGHLLAAVRQCGSTCALCRCSRGRLFCVCRLLSVCRSCPCPATNQRGSGGCSCVVAPGGLASSRLDRQVRGKGTHGHHRQFSRAARSLRMDQAVGILGGEQGPVADSGRRRQSVYLLY
jgi:hypothetical protein